MDLIHQSLCRLQTGKIRHWMSRLQDPCVPADLNRAVAINHQPFERAVPGFFKSRSHLGGRLAGTYDDSPALRLWRQMSDDGIIGIGGQYGGLKEGGQKRPFVDYQLILRLSRDHGGNPVVHSKTIVIVYYPIQFRSREQGKYQAQMHRSAGLSE
jgi:hypothetical protein